MMLYRFEVDYTVPGKMGSKNYVTAVAATDAAHARVEAGKIFEGLKEDYGYDKALGKLYSASGICKCIAEFKKNDLWGVGMHDVAAPVDEIENDLQQDLDEVSEFGDKNPLVAAAFWHARFEGVHAFADGNGRTGRAMMNYYLLLHNHPPIVIFDEDRKDYYAALDGFDMTGDLKPLIGFLRRETCKTWESAVQREDRSHQMSLEEKRETVSRRVSLNEINHDFDVR